MNDYQQITNALSKYIHGLDENDPELFSSAFTKGEKRNKRIFLTNKIKKLKDAKLSFPIRNLKIEGEEKLKSFVTGFHNKFKNISHMEGKFQRN